MIYMLSETDISLLLTLSGFACNNLSPFFETIDINDYYQNETKAMMKISLIQEFNNTYKLTPEGKLLSEILLRPDAVATIGKRTDKDGLYNICRREGLWVVSLYSKEFNLYIIRSFFTTHLLGKWLKENLYSNYKNDILSSTVLDLQLSYDEWYVFLLSQYVNMQKDTLSISSAEDDGCFTIDSLMQPETINYFKKGLTDLSNKEHSEKITVFLKEDGLEKLKAIILELAKKNVFTVKNGKLTYTEMALEWLDNRLLLNTLYFNYKKANVDYTVLFTLRRNGITALYESENGVRLISSSNIPWVFYLQ
ncbi:MAG: hypothetical protein K0S55_112 [Clostridia bacterium]|nr:hypothetical protein [Clostridia bacterium]